MLRLNLSRISLEKKDLDYHKKTHQRRQAARVHDHSAVDPAWRSSQIPLWTKSRKASPARPPKKPLSASPVKTLASQQITDDSPISRDPVPQGSRAFWDKVLAEAGTPTRTRSTGSGNGKVINPSDEWLGINRSARASIEEGSDSDSISQGDRTSNKEARIPDQTSHRLSSLESLNSTSISNVDGNMVRIDTNTSLESIRHPATKSRFSNLFRRRPKTVDDVEGTQPHDNLDLGLDGHTSDIPRYHGQEDTNPSETSYDHWLKDEFQGRKSDLRTIPINLETAMGHGVAQNQNPFGEPMHRSRVKSPPTVLAAPVDSLRRPSGTLPRSPLYISQAASSSSPQKSPAIPCVRNNSLMVESPSLLFLPPRRRTTYRPRSKTYSFETSEASSTTTQVGFRAATPPELDMPRPLTFITSPFLTSMSASPPVSTRPTSPVAHAEPCQASTEPLDPSSPATQSPLNHSRLTSNSSSRLELPGDPFNLSHSRATSRSSSQVQCPSFSPQYVTDTHHQSQYIIHASSSSVHMSSGRSSALPQCPRQSPIEMEKYRSVSHNTSLSDASSPFSSSHRGLSPYALPFMPRNTRNRSLTPQYPLPPPFNATPRTISYGCAMPNSISPMPQAGTSPIFPCTPSPHSGPVTGNPPSTPPCGSFAIYNDSQPPQTQPQTPADLHRRPRPNFSNTAPARSRTSFVLPAATRHVVPGEQAYASPTRARETPARFRSGVSPMRMGGMVSADAENADAVTWEERERRRVWNEGVRLGREEQRRLEMSPGLLRNPGT